MSTDAATTGAATSALRLTFEGGTLLVEGLAEGDTRGLPGLRYDPRARMHRAEAIH